jgi:hypothetical protein
MTWIHSVNLNLNSKVYLRVLRRFENLSEFPRNKNDESEIHGGGQPLSRELDKDEQYLTTANDVFAKNA